MKAYHSHLIFSHRSFYVASALLLISLSLGCDTLLPYSVTVLDESQNPVPNAAIEIRPDCGTEKVPRSFSRTDAEGKASGAVISSGDGDFFIWIHADGFQEYCRKERFTEEGIEIAATLKPRIPSD